MLPPVNLLAYTKLKEFAHQLQPQYDDMDLPPLQTALCGLLAGAAGPMSNAPLDTLSKCHCPECKRIWKNLPKICRHVFSANPVMQLETLVQKSPRPASESGISHITKIAVNLFRQEGYRALYKGVTPRIMRIAPGQAITYTMYESIKSRLTQPKS